MSYILDALRRADNERDRGQVPGLNAQPAPWPATATPARPAVLTPALAIGLGMVLLAGLAWWLWPRGTAPAPTTAGTAASAAVASVVTASAPAMSVPGPAAMPEPPPLPMVVSAPPPPAPAPSLPAPTPAPVIQLPAPAAPSVPPPVALADLTAQQLRDWPPLALGGAVHSDNPASRFLIVNGQLVHEGEEAAPGVTVERIDPRAAILRWRELRVELPL